MTTSAQSKPTTACHHGKWARPTVHALVVTMAGSRRNTVANIGGRRAILQEVDSKTRA
jgi:hypothetical protein